MRASSLGSLSVTQPTLPTVVKTAQPPEMSHGCPLSNLNAAERSIVEALVPFVRLSKWSLFSPYSLLSVGSILSTLGLCAILSMFSCGSILSGASIGSVLSFGSVGSVMSIGCVGGFMEICW